MKFIARYGVMSGQYKSTLGSNFHLCVSRFKFNQWAFSGGCVNSPFVHGGLSVLSVGTLLISFFQQCQNYEIL